MTIDIKWFFLKLRIDEPEYTQIYSKYFSDRIKKYSLTNKITYRLIQTPETTWRYPWQIFTQSIDQYYTVKKINEKNWNLLEKDKKHQTNFFIPGFGRNFNWEYKISSLQIDLFWNLVLSIFLLTL